MNWKLGFIAGLLWAGGAYAQDVPTVDKEQQLAIPIVDSLYREDQFYAGVTYNSMLNAPHALSQDKFSTGLSVGFLRDVPVNKMRTLAVAAGVGYAYNIYHHNLRTLVEGDSRTYEIVPDQIDYSTNRTSLHDIDFPIELRWRNSTFQSHKFWRVYAGVKITYNLRNRLFYRGEDQSFEFINNPDVRKWRTGIYLAAGYNTWNVYAYYGLTSLYDGAKVEGRELKMNALHLGLQFYIL